jgi:hypothetical protein
MATEELKEYYEKYLHSYMGTLLEAGFDVQFVLTKGYEVLWTHEYYANEYGCTARSSSLEYGLKVAEMIRDVAKKLGIDRVSQRQAYEQSKRQSHFQLFSNDPN